jgi:hypothetical protein
MQGYFPERLCLNDDAYTNKGRSQVNRAGHFYFKIVKNDVPNPLACVILRFEDQLLARQTKKTPALAGVMVDEVDILLRLLVLVEQFLFLYPV